MGCTPKAYLALIAVSLVQVLLCRGKLGSSVLQVSGHGLHLIRGALLVGRLCNTPQQKT